MIEALDEYIKFLYKIVIYKSYKKIIYRFKLALMETSQMTTKDIKNNCYGNFFLTIEFHNN